MHELYEEITGQNDSTNVPAAPPPRPPVPARLPSSVEENGKNGSCGASVSEKASTVMAGVHFTCCRAAGEPSSMLSAAAERFREAREAGGGGGGDGAEVDDEWLEKALSWVPLMEGIGG
ncbi:hypothetical protein BT93_H0538 [Corymbia citriodora subsp. variegata]|nr:hypothetical protein BT93_H0538 [Corymbia citriodora subsp. variegata]